MKKILMTLAALAVLCTTAQAGKPNGNSGNKPIGNGNSGNKPKVINNVVNKPVINQSNPVKPSKPLQLTPKHTQANYHLTFGTKASFGYCFKGKHHDHWTYCCYYDSYGCNCYWCPCTCVYYYWCAPDQCWYPLSYCPYGVYTW